MATDGHSDEPLADVLGSVHSLLLNGPRLEDLLGKLARMAATVVQAPASCGMTIRYDGQPRTIVTSDPRAAMIDEQQYMLGEGPCLDALETGEVVDVADQASEYRWSRYRDSALELGVTASLSFPLIVHDQIIGALNLYGYDRPNTFSEADRERAAAVADQATTILAFAAQAAQQSQLSGQLERALASRSVIDQALGLLMAQQNCDARTAFDLLRRHSQNTHRTLRDVAADLITKLTGQAPVDSRTFEPDDDSDGSLSG